MWIFDICAVNAVSPLDVHWPQCPRLCKLSSHNSGWEICTCGGNHKKSLFEEQKITKKLILILKCKFNWCGWMKKCDLASCEKHFQRKYGPTESSAYITAPADPWGPEASVGVLEVLLFSYTLLFHRTFLSAGPGCTNQLCWPWWWDWNQGTITSMSLLENVPAQPGFVYSHRPV